MSINASLIKELRAMTGSGMMDCKEALVENKGDIEESVTWLRKKGLSSVQKKADRAANEGVVAVYLNGKDATMVEVNSETDFVGKNEKFLSLVNIIVESAHNFKGNSVEDFLKDGVSSDGKSIQELISENIAVIGENIVLGKLSKLHVDSGEIIAYLHNKLSDNIGKVGVLVGIEGEFNDKVSEIATNIAMHIAATKPASLTKEDLDQKILDNEKAIFIEQAKQSGKPDAVIEKMVKGRIQKFINESVLLEQNFVMDGKTKICDVVKNAEKETGCKFQISGFSRISIEAPQ